MSQALRRHMLNVLVALAVAALPGMASAALSLTLLQSPDLGLFFAGASGRQFELRPDGTVTGTDSGDYISGAVEGQFTITDDTAPLAINILADNVITSGGLSVTKVTCTYRSWTYQVCSGSGLSVTSASTDTLYVGLDVSTTQAHTGGDVPTVSMDISVSYE